jgi:hypothetical protein
MFVFKDLWVRHLLYFKHEIYVDSKPVNANFALISKKRTKILSPVYGALKHTMPPAAQGT